MTARAAARIVVASLVAAGLVSAVHSQQGSDAPDGVRDVEGPNGVRRSIAQETEHSALFDLQSRIPWAEPYFDYKRRMKEEHGLTFSLSAHLLLQEASDTLDERTSGFGNIFRFQGSWIALARDTGHAGQLDWRFENRTALGGSRAPFELGEDAGVTALSSANGYTDEFDAGFSILSWTQRFLDQRGVLVAGLLAYDVYQDALFVQGFSRGFLNRGIFLNPTIGTTGVGALGAVAQGFVTDNVWVGAQIFDANARSAELDLDTVREGEFLKNVDVGWTPSADRYETDRVHLTVWEKDEREAAGIAGGHGWAFSASYEVRDGLLPFLRCGRSDGGAGAAAEASAALGFELSTRKDQAFSLGLMWAQPSEATYGPGVEDEYAIETSYQFQFSRNISMMPDVQLLLDPANNPDRDRVWIVGVRAIVSI